jgi:ATP-binding cassette subfamily A (ABC1) protein 3
MSMLTGLFSPNGGTAYINGKDIRSELDEARASLGICAQHNILFEELTVKEHLMFFCSLKGMVDDRLVAEEVRRYATLLGIKDKMDAQSKTLSGGMKRRLSIAIALCGDAKIVILDEPTSGMDPDARRSLWDLLIAEKKGRTILLSTHFMDEADILGDRIAIMTEGRLRTVGTSFFLKKKFGTGYRLTVVKKEGFQSIGIMNLLNKFSIDTHIESDEQTEAIFVISEEHLPLFEQMFRALEDNTDSLRISSFGCSLSTLEEVFLKLGIESLHHGENGDETDHHQRLTEYENIQVHGVDLCATVSGFQLTLYQIEAMLLKKFHVFRRTWKTLLYIALFNVWMIVVVMSAPSINFSGTNQLKISLDTYEDTETILQNDGSPFSSAYQALFTGKDHVTTISSDISDYILEKYNKSFSDVSQKYLAGATLSKDSITAWFNGQPYHTVPLTLSLINRAILKELAGAEYELTVSNRPYNMPIKDSDTHMAIYENPVEMIFALVVIFMLFVYWPVIFIGPYIKEKESRAKLLQYISGTNRYIFWLTSFFFDYVVFVFICCAIIGCIGIYQHNHFATFAELSVLVLISCSYAFAMLPFIYALSYLFTKHSTGETMVSLFSMLCK